MAKAKKTASKVAAAPVAQSVKKPFNWGCCCIIGAFVFLLGLWLIYELLIKWILPVPFL